MATRQHPPIYLDYNASAPVLPHAAERMADALRTVPGNPSSPHGFGQHAKDVLETARARLAALLGYARRDVTFTSGGSESNTMLLRALEYHPGGAHLITSPIEHPSILRTAEWLAGRGVAVSYLPVDGQGVVEVEAVADLLRPETRVVSVMAANNETGVIQPLAALAAAVRAHAGDKVVVHSDAVQAFGRIPLPLAEWGVDAATVAAHKLGGPKGIGALAARQGMQPLPLVLGGRQERGLRAGTESVFLAEGFVAAAEWVWERFAAHAERMTALRDRLIGHLREAPGFFLNGEGAARLPNTANIGIEGVAAESLLVAMDLAGVAVSTGAACQSGAVEPSHVLLAMGQPEARVRSALRVSMGHATTEAEIDRCAEVMLAEAARLRRARRRAAS